MRYIFSLLSLFALTANAQDSLTTVSYYSDINYPFVNDIPIVRGAYGGTRIIPSFVGDWDPDQKAAFTTACQLWEEVMPTTFPIKIEVNIEQKSTIFSNNSALSEVTPASCNDSTDYYAGKPYAPCQLNSQIKGVSYMILTGEYDGDLSDFIENESLVNEPDIVIKYFCYTDKNLSDIYSFSLDPNSVEAGKYDFVTFAMRDIAKGLGLESRIRARHGRLIYNPEYLTPFECYILQSLPSNLDSAYVHATLGSLNMTGEWGEQYTLYAPNNWSNSNSLKYFIPNDNIKVTELLSCNFGLGTVMRDISDYKTNNIFSELLGWNGLTLVGMGSTTSVDVEGTDNSSPYSYHGSISFSGNGLNGNLSPMQGVNLQTNGTNAVSFLDTQTDDTTFDVYKFHPNYYNGNTEADRRSIAILKQNGEWDVIYKDPWAFFGEELDVNYSDMEFHFPDSVYARTYDGYLRGRYSVNKTTDTGSDLTVRYFMLEDIPQKVEMQPARCRFLSEYDNIYDEYTGVLRVPICKTEGATRIVVAQYDDGDEYPFYYDVPNIKDNYFLAVVDREYSTRFVITAYNSNGHTSSSMYTYTPPQMQNNSPLTFLRDGDNVAVQSRKGDEAVQDVIVSSLSPFPSSEKVQLVSGKIDISSLTKDKHYVLSVTTESGKSSEYKFIK